MFVLDFVPEKYLKGGKKNGVVVFTAGWAMKFVPLLGRALKDMALSDGSDYAKPHFAMTRKDDKTGKGIIIDPETDKAASEGLGIITQRQAKGSSIRNSGSGA